MGYEVITGQINHSKKSYHICNLQARTTGPNIIIYLQMTSSGLTPARIISQWTDGPLEKEGQGCSVRLQVRVRDGQHHNTCVRQRLEHNNTQEQEPSTFTCTILHTRTKPSTSIVCYVEPFALHSRQWAH